jgi:tripartite-type tricarboxylate transporter receptor subunit TctC
MKAIFGMRANVPASFILSIVDRLNGSVVKALGDAVVRDTLATLGLDGPPAGERTPQALRAFQKSEIEKWWPIIKAAHITAE